VDLEKKIISKVQPKKDNTNNKMKEMKSGKKKEEATVNGIIQRETQVTKFFHLQRYKILSANQNNIRCGVWRR